MFSIYICKVQELKYIFYLALFAYEFSIYYLIKDILIYNKTKKEYLKTLTDIEEITKKIGDNAKIEHLSKINEEYDTYNKYKTIKNKTFKSDGITYYSNGRIQSMTYRESN